MNTGTTLSTTLTDMNFVVKFNDFLCGHLMLVEIDSEEEQKAHVRLFLTKVSMWFMLAVLEMK